MRFYFIFFLITQGFFFNTNALTLDDAIKNIENTGSKKNDTKDVKKFVCTKSFHSNFRKGPDVNFPIEYEILNCLYFVEPFDKITEELSYPPTVVRDVLRNLIHKKLVVAMLWVEEIQDYKKSFIYVSDNMFAYSYLITKDGLLAHNSR